MSGPQFSRIERDMIKSFLALKSRPLEIADEKTDTDFEVFSDDNDKQKEFFTKNLLKLKDCPEFSKDFMNFFNSGEKLHVSFYFNGLGVYFNSKIAIFNNSFCLCFPDSFFKITEDLKKGDSKFSVTLFYGFESRDKFPSRNFLPVRCPVNQALIEKKSLDLKTDDSNSLDFRVRNWISSFIAGTEKNAKLKMKIGNGLFLISAGAYFFSGEKRKVEQFKGRKKAPQVIYLDERRIVFASEKENMILSEGKDYKVRLSFPLPRPINFRNVDLVCVADLFIENPEKTKICVSASISEIKEEDRRFLSELPSF